MDRFAARRLFTVDCRSGPPPPSRGATGAHKVVLEKCGSMHGVQFPHHSQLVKQTESSQREPNLPSHEHHRLTQERRSKKPSVRKSADQNEHRRGPIIFYGCRLSTIDALGDATAATPRRT